MFANLFSNFEKKNMQDLWSNSSFWRILINSIGVLSILFGGWLIFKLLKAFLVNKKAKRLMDKKFINIKNLPAVFNDSTQICLVVSHTQNVVVNLLDNDENSILKFHDGEISVGEKIFILETNKFKNGDYHISIKTQYQNIFRKIRIQN